MTSVDDAQIIKKVIDNIVKDLGVPASHPVRKLLERIGEGIIRDLHKDTNENYERAMKGIK